MIPVPFVGRDFFIFNLGGRMFYAHVKTKERTTLWLCKTPEALERVLSQHPDAFRGEYGDDFPHLDDHADQIFLYYLHNKGRIRDALVAWDNDPERDIYEFIVGHKEPSDVDK